MKSSQPWIRRSQRVIRMVSELHRLGYQRIRIMPYEYPLAWRLYVAPASTFSRHNGAFVPDALRDYERFPTYSSASENEYFEWKDAKGDNARALAEKLIQRFPILAEEGRDRDWAYAGWLAELVGHLESGGDILPFVYAEHLPTRPYSLRGLPIRRFGEQGGYSEEFPLPPPGELDDDRAPYSGEGGSSGLLAALEIAAQPNYLGSPDVVSGLVQKILAVEVEIAAGRAKYADFLAVNREVTGAFTAEDSEFTRMPGWHTVECLGKAVVKYFNLQPEHYSGENLYGILSEGFAAVSLHIRRMIKAFQQDDKAKWNPDALQQLNELHHWVVSVLLGTNVVHDADRTLEGFRWRPVE